MSGSPLFFDFDFVNLIISGKASGNFAAENDLYSDSKELIVADTTGIAAAAPPPFLESNDGITRAGGSVGGNPIGNNQFISPYFFINNIDGWRLRPAEEDGETTITGNLFPLDANTPFLLPTVGNFTQLLRLIVSPQSITDASSGALTALQNLLLEQIHGQARRSVHINTEQSPGGTEGYQQLPFNNFTDAVDYAETNNLHHMIIDSDVVVDRQLKNFEIQGDAGLPAFDLNDQIMDGSTVRNCEIRGTQGKNGNAGQLVCYECSLNNVRDFDGAASLVGGIGSIEFMNGTVSLLNELIPFVAGGAVDIDLKAAESPALPSTVGIQNASGLFTVSNLDDSGDALHMTIKQGAVTINASCIAGTIVIAGQANITDNSGPGCIVITDANIQPLGVKLVQAMVAGDAEVSLDDGTVTVYDYSVSPRTVLGVYTVSADGRIRTRTS